MSNGEAPFQTKFTLGLLTIEPCPQPENGITDIEEKSAEVIAIEDAAREAIKAKKAKKAARQKSRSMSPSGKKKPSRKKSGDLEEAKKKALELKAKKQAEQEEKARKAAEKLAAKKKKQEEEEEARKEAARLKREQEEAEAEAARLRAEEKEEEARAAKLAAEMDVSMQEAAIFEPVEELPTPTITRIKPKRRISMFPVTQCGDNAGLDEAVKRYGNNVPFDWEKPEWTKEHVNLKHTSTISHTYGWQKPDWTRRSMLKKTMLGDRVKQGASLAQPITHVNANRRPNHHRRRHSLTGRSNFEVTSKLLGEYKPEWVARNLLKTTEMGEAARLGLNLSVPVPVIKAHMSGKTEEELVLDNSWGRNSFASLNASQKNIHWEKPDWVKNPTLRPTEMGAIARRGRDIGTSILMVDGGCLMGGDANSPNGSAATLGASQKNIGWEKPSWVNASLKKTTKGKIMKETGTLAKPIVYSPNRPKGMRSPDNSGGD